jgi:uncharacterized protein YjbI with pentapeptide repeats
MKIEIKTVFGKLIFEGDFSSVAKAVRAALAAKNSLSYANLRYADLSSADLSSANLSSVDLSYADLRYADLSSADLRYANLRYANLRYADLSSADLRYANLSSANLSSAKNSELAIARTRILPQGTLIGWKWLRGGVIARLRIPEAAKRSHAFGRKCRAEFADVLDLFSADGTEFSGVGVSTHNPKFTYTVGATVRPEEPFSDDWTEECAAGIHFFITREEAVAYGK